MGTISQLSCETVTDAFNARDLDRFANALAEQLRLIGNAGEPL
jgi:hypothetical protein